MNKTEYEIKKILREKEFENKSSMNREIDMMVKGQKKYIDRFKKALKNEDLGNIDVVNYINNKILNEFLIKFIRKINNEYNNSYNAAKKSFIFETIKMMEINTKKLKDPTKNITTTLLKRYNKACENEEDKIELIPNFYLVDFAKIADIITNNIISGVLSAKTINQIARSIGNEFNDELQFNHMVKNHSGLLSVKLNDLKYTSYSHLRKSVIFTANKLEISDYEKLDDKSKLKIGKMFIKLFEDECSNLICIENKTYKNKTTSDIKPTTEFKKEIDRMFKLKQYSTVQYKPLTIKPKPWTSVYDGGYYTIKRLNFIKTNKEHLEIADKMDLTDLFTKVNKIQDVPLRINKKVYDVMNHLYLNSIDDIININNESVLPVEIKEESQPQRPPSLNADVSKMNDLEKEKFDETLDKYKSDLHHWYYDKAKSASKRNMMREILEISSEYLTEKFYMPHQLDSRGRVYPVPMYLNSQSNDYSKGLLTLAAKRKLTDRGVKALKFHIANVFAFNDIDKQSFDKKVKWTEENEDLILEIANNPYNSTEWHNADKPWQALAACFEYAGYKKFGNKFKSNIIVDVDGSNNGLQHFAAILLDQETAELTNIANNDKPNDSYKVIANIIINKFMNEKDMYDDEKKELIKMWFKFGLDRKICKSPVMTYAYSSTPSGWMNQIIGEIKKRISNGAKDVFKGKIRDGADLLKEELIIAMPETLKAPAKAMKVIQKYGLMAAKKSDYLLWVNPIGFPLYMRYNKSKSKSVDMRFFRKRISIRYSFDLLDKVDTYKIINAISPNFVHSIDSSHLFKIITGLTKRLVNDFIFVHDSFGCHPNDLHIMNEVVREEFVDLHKEHHLFNFLKTILDNAKIKYDVEELREETARGNFDLSEVLKSLYSFN